MKKAAIAIVCIVSCFCGNAQNVGIGLTNPTRARLEVNGVAGTGATSALFATTSNAPGCISFQRNWPTIGFNQYRDATTPGSQGKYMATGYAAIQFLDPTSGFLAFDVFPSGFSGNTTPAAIRAMTIAVTGNVSINTGSSTAALTIGHLDADVPTVIFKGTQYNSVFNRRQTSITFPIEVRENTDISGGKPGSNLYINDPVGLGNVIFMGTTGINWAYPSVTFLVKQANNTGIRLAEKTFSRNWQFVVLPNLTEPGSDLYLLYNGNNVGNFYHANGIYSHYSDERVKTNIRQLQPVSRELMALKPVSFQMLNANDKQNRSIGFIAQEVQKVFPQLVLIRRDDNPATKTISDLHTLDYGSLNVVSIKAIQEQQLQIARLKQEQAELLNELLELESKIKK